LGEGLNVSTRVELSFVCSEAISMYFASSGFEAPAFNFSARAKFAVHMLSLTEERSARLRDLAIDTFLRDPREPETTFVHVSQANARSVNAWFFRGYVSWKKGDVQVATAMLRSARAAIGPDWKPAGSALEGDVRQRMFNEAGFLGVFAQQWDGTLNPASAFRRLDEYLGNIR